MAASEELRLCNATRLTSEPDEAVARLFKRSRSSDFERAVRAAHKLAVATLDSDGCTPLQWAVFYGTTEDTDLLLGHGADPDVRFAGGHTALHILVANDAVEKASELLAWSATTTLRDDRGWTPLEYACIVANRGGEFIDALFEFATPDEADEARREGVGLLHAAVSRGKHAAAEALLRHGFDPNARLSGGDPAQARLILPKSMRLSTPLHMAALFDNAELVPLLALHGAEMNVIDGHGLTPLSTAVVNDRTEVASALVENGADMFAQRGRLRPPVWAAFALEKYDMLRTLLEFVEPVELDHQLALAMSNNWLENDFVPKTPDDEPLMPLAQPLEELGGNFSEGHAPVGFSILVCLFWLGLRLRARRARTRPRQRRPAGLRQWAQQASLPSPLLLAREAWNRLAALSASMLLALQAKLRAACAGRTTPIMPEELPVQPQPAPVASASAGSMRRRRNAGGGIGGGRQKRSRRQRTSMEPSLPVPEDDRQRIVEQGMSQAAPAHADDEGGAEVERHAVEQETATLADALKLAADLPPAVPLPEEAPLPDEAPFADTDHSAEPPQPATAPEPWMGEQTQHSAAAVQPAALPPSLLPSVLPPLRPVPIPIPLPLPLPPKPPMQAPSPLLAAKPPAPEPPLQQPLCTVCMDAPLEGAFMPCRHLAACVACGEQVMLSTSRCPVCREPSAGFERFFICGAS